MQQFRKEKPQQTPQLSYPSLSYRSIRKNQCFLAIVTRIANDGLQIQCLNGIHGFVPKELMQSKAALSELYRINQYLAVKYIDQMNNQTIFDINPTQLSQYPKLHRRLQVIITKEEENGFYCSIGSKSQVTIILPKTNICAQNLSKINISSIIQVIITNISGNILTVSELTTKQNTELAILPTHLIPGDIIEAKVTQVSKVTLLTPTQVSSVTASQQLQEYNYLLDFVHFKRPQKISNDYQPFVGFQGKFKVIAVDQFSNNIYLSNIQHILEEQIPKQLDVNFYDVIYKDLQLLISKQIIFGTNIIKYFANDCILLNSFPFELIKQLPEESNSNLCRYMASINLNDQDFDQNIQQLELIMKQFIFTFSMRKFKQLNIQKKAGECFNYFTKLGSFQLFEQVYNLETVNLNDDQDCYKEINYTNLGQLQNEIKKASKIYQLDNIVPANAKNNQVLTVGQIIIKSAIQQFVITDQRESKIFCHLQLKIGAQLIKFSCQINNLHIPDQILEKMRHNQNILMINEFKQLKVLQVYDQNINKQQSIVISLIDYGQDYSFNKNEKHLIGQIAKGAVVYKSQFTYVAEFMNGIRAQVPFFSLQQELELKQCYNFQLLQVVNNSQLIVGFTQNNCNNEVTKENLINVFNLNHLIEYQADQAKNLFSYNDKMTVKLTGVAPQAFLCESIDGRTQAILPKINVKDEKQLNQLLNDVLNSKEPQLQVFVTNIHPLIVSISQVPTESINHLLLNNQKYIGTVLYFSGHFILLKCPGNDSFFRFSEQNMKPYSMYQQIKIMCGEKLKADFNCYNCRNLERQQGSIEESQKIFTNIQLEKTKNINGIFQATEALKMKDIKGYPLIQVNNSSLLNGYLIDLGNGIIGYISMDQIKDQELKTDVLQTFKPQAILQFIGKEELQLIELADYNTLDQKQQAFGIQIVLLSLVHKHDKQVNDKYQVVVKKIKEDYILGEFINNELSGQLILMHVTDNCQNIKQTVQFLSQYQQDQIVFLDKNFIHRINHQSYLSKALSDSNAIGPILNIYQNCAYYYQSNQANCNFLYLNTDQNVQFIFKDMIYYVTTSLSSQPLKLPIYHIPEFDISQQAKFSTYYTYSTLKNQTLSLLSNQLKQSANDVEIGDILVGFVTVVQQGKIYLKISEGLNCQIFDYNLDYDQLAQLHLEQKYQRGTRVIFRVVKKLFPDCVAGVALKHCINKTFCFQQDVHEKQHHIARIKQFASNKIYLELADTHPQQHAYVLFNMVRAKCTKEQLEKMYKINDFVHCVIINIQKEEVDGKQKTRVEVAMAPEAFVTAGIEAGQLFPLQEQKEKVSKNLNKTFEKFKEKVNDTKQIYQNQEEEQQDNGQNKNDDHEESENYEENQDESLNFDEQEDNILKPNQIEQQDTENNNQNEQQNVQQNIDIANKFKQDNNEYSPDDYEKLLIQQPYSSYIYIQYINYYIISQQLQNAFQLITRALQTIPIGDQQLLQERINILLIKINIIDKFQQKQQLQEEIVKLINTFEAPALLCRNISENFLQSQNKQNYFQILEEMFKVLFTNKKRRKEIINMKSYIIYVFASGQQNNIQKINFKQIVDNLECQNQEKYQFMQFIAEQYYIYKQVEKGRLLFSDLINQTNNRLEFILEWTSIEEKHCDIQQIRDLYQQLVNKDYGSKKKKILPIVFKKFHNFEKTRGGEEKYVQELAAMLTSE